MSELEIREHADPRGFYERARSFLLAAEAEHNVILGLEGWLARADHPFEPPLFLATVERDGTVVGCAVRTPPFNLSVTRMPLEALPLLARRVAARFETLPAVLGEETVTRGFAEAWVDEAGGSFQRGRPQRIWSLERVVEPRRPAPGHLRPATADDLDLVVGWADGFGDDTGLRLADPRRWLRAWMETGDLLLWDDGGPRCMAAGVARTPSGVRIGYVYTPAADRGRGYASSCTAAASRHYLEQGRRFCCLYTDLDNPTSNAIYAAVGYRPVCDVVDYDFSAPSSA
jgi:predicted GNAT family acetyltransferase